MVRADVLAAKVARAAARLDDAEALLARPENELVADVARRDLNDFAPGDVSGRHR